MMTARLNLIGRAEQLFMCMDGPKRAFFEIPQADNEPVRAIYVVYAARSPIKEDLCDWMGKLLIQLHEAGGAYLYWRIDDMIELVKDGDNHNRDMWRIYTRIVVLDKDLKPVVLEGDVKHEGEIAPIVRAYA